MHLTSLANALAVKSNCTNSYNDPLAVSIAKFGEQHDVTQIVRSFAMSETSAPARAASRQLLEMAGRESLITKINQVSPFRKGLFNLPTLANLTGSTASFTADGQQIPVSSNSFETLTLKTKTISGIALATDEAARTYDLNTGITSDLARALASGESSAFINQNAETDDAPAGILSGVAPAQPDSHYLGVTPFEDIALLIESFTGDLTKAVFVTSAKSAYRLVKDNVLMQTTGALGGTIAGISHVTSQSIPDNWLVLLDPSRIILASSGEVNIEVSKFGAINVIDSNNELEAISLMQTNSVAYKIQRQISWKSAVGAVSWVSIDWSAV